ncbi:hypothetical protein [Pseudomonas sp. NPDC089401]|uniref:hypothetical protein n=1 Tax=Pseudomonas sp. NPDC089401 TaxID=3364462 RepID=UPI0037F5C9D8
MDVTTRPAAEGIYYDYEAIKSAARILRDCRIETECFLTSKRATVAIGMGGRAAKESIVMLAGLGGAAAGSVVPVAGTLAGGFLAATATREILPEYNLAPVTDPGALIAKKANGSMTAKFATWDFHRGKARDLVMNEAGNRAVNAGLSALGAATPPAYVPFSWLYQNAKDLYKTKRTSKPDLIRELQFGVMHAEFVIEQLDAKIRKAFRERGRMRQYRDLLNMSAGPRELGVEVINHPLLPHEWKRLSSYERHHRHALAELGKLKRVVCHAACRLLVNPRETAV